MVEGVVSFVKNSTEVEKSFWASALVGAATFPSLLGAVQHGLFKPFRLHCAAKYSSLLGLASVGLASYGASWISLRAFEYFQGEKVNVSIESFTEPEVVTSTLGGLLVFRAFGGKFKNVLPSHLLHPGAFAYNSLPASLLQRINTSIREKIQVVGRRYGCHSCGTRLQTRFIVDHQPPSMLVRQSMNGSGDTQLMQQFFPQCMRCSTRQGSACAAFLKQSKEPASAIVTHASSFRLYHVFTPLPATLVLAKEYLSSSKLSDLARAYEIALSHVVESVAATTKRYEETNGCSSKSSAVASGRTSAVKTEEQVCNQTEDHSVSSKANVVGETPTTWSDFPPAIVWRHIVKILTSLHSPLAAYHLTLWTFMIVAAFGTI